MRRLADRVLEPSLRRLDDDRADRGLGERCDGLEGAEGEQGERAEPDGLDGGLGGDEQDADQRHPRDERAEALGDGGGRGVPFRDRGEVGRGAVEAGEALVRLAGEREFGRGVEGLDELVHEHGPRRALAPELAAGADVGERGDERGADGEPRAEDEPGERQDRRRDGRRRQRRDGRDRRRPAHAQIAVLELVDVDHEPAQQVGGGKLVRPCGDQPAVPAHAQPGERAERRVVRRDPLAVARERPHEPERPHDHDRGQQREHRRPLRGARDEPPGRREQTGRRDRRSRPERHDPHTRVARWRGFARRSATGARPWSLVPA